MKLNKITAALLAACMTLGLAACGAEADAASESAAESTAESAAEDAAETVSTDETAEDAYAYLADFTYDGLFDDNGYLAGISALDYVTLPEGYDDITLDAELGQVSDEDIAEYLSDNLLADYATVNEITDRAAEDGDTVNIDFVGSIDGVEFEGGNSGGSGYDLVLGSGSFIDDFEDQIVGHMPGETFDVVATFPDTYPSTDLAGKEAVFSTTLNYISEEVEPELTDEWVAENLQETMGFSTAAEVNDFAKDTLLLLFDQQSGDVSTAVADKLTVADEMPEELLNYYRDMYLYMPYEYAVMYGTTTEEILTGSGYESAEDYLESVQSDIDASARQLLIMQAIAEDKGIVCDDAALASAFSRYFGQTDSSIYTDYYGTNFVKMMLLQSIVMQDLIDNVSYE